VTLEVLESLTSKNAMPTPIDDPSGGAEYCSTKGKASKAVRVVLASNLFRLAGNQRSQRNLADQSRQSNASGEESAQQQPGSAGAVSPQNQPA
jgi:hypothetical protein